MLVVVGMLNLLSKLPFSGFSKFLLLISRYYYVSEIVGRRYVWILSETERVKTCALENRFSLFLWFVSDDLTPITTATSTVIR